MSTLLHPLPNLRQLKALDKLIGKNVDPAPAIEMIKHYPGLARTDPEWYATFPDEAPPLIAAILCGQPEIVDALLRAGSDPQCMGKWGSPATAVLLTNNTGAAQVRILELLLADPRCDMTAMNFYGQPAIMSSYSFMAPSLPEDIDKKRTEAFLAALERTPLELLQNASHNAIEKLATQTHRVSEGAAIAILRAYVNRGVDINGLERLDTHPILRAQQNNMITLAAELLAMGADESQMVQLNNAPVRLGEEIKPEVRRRAKERLSIQIGMEREGLQTLEQLFFAPNGRASWTAQGLAMQGMLDALFTEEKFFASYEEKKALALRLADVLPERCKSHFSIPVTLLRNEPLARPDNAATVGYARGSVSEAGKGVAS